jgi:ABC-type sugar transport system substrate-binding protein
LGLIAGFVLGGCDRGAPPAQTATANPPAAQAPAAAASGGKGEVVIIDQPTVASVQDRVRGFEEGIKKYPGITIVAKPNGNGNRASATQVMEDMPQAHHDIKGVFGINDVRRLAQRV